MTARCPSHARTDVSIRDLVTIIDEPVEHGGTNLGASPTEKTGLDVQSLNARFDRRGVMLEEEIEIPFPDVAITITLSAQGRQDALTDVKTNLRRSCPIAKIFTNSGSNVSENWIVTLNGKED